MITLNAREARTAAAVFDTLFPADEHGPAASEIGVVDYLDRALAGAYADLAETYRLGLAALDRAARDRHATPLADCAQDQRDALTRRARGRHAPRLPRAAPAGLLQDAPGPPARGTLRGPGLRRQPRQAGLEVPGASWRLAGELRRREHVRRARRQGRGDTLPRRPRVRPRRIGRGDFRRIPGYDPQRGAEPPSGPADVVLVGVGGVGGLVAPVLAKAGLRVVGLEAGPWREARRLRPGRARQRVLLPGQHGPEVPRRDPALAPRRGRAHPRGHLLAGSHDERRRGIHPALRRLAEALPPPPLRAPHPRARAFRGEDPAGGAARWPTGPSPTTTSSPTTP